MEEFVNFELAMKLKEKGFKEECLAYYDVIDNVGLLYNTQYTNDLSPCQYTDLLQSHNTDVAAYQSDDSEYCVDAPTIPHVVDWLRKTRKIYVSVEVECGDWFEYKIVQTIEYASHNSTKVYKTYNAAILAGIEDVLNNLI